MVMYFTLCFFFRVVMTLFSYFFSGYHPIVLLCALFSSYRSSLKGDVFRGVPFGCMLVWRLLDAVIGQHHQLVGYCDWSTSDGWMW